MQQLNLAQSSLILSETQSSTSIPAAYDNSLEPKQASPRDSSLRFPCRQSHSTGTKFAHPEQNRISPARQTLNPKYSLYDL